MSDSLTPNPTETVTIAYDEFRQLGSSIFQYQVENKELKELLEAERKKVSEHIEAFSNLLQRLHLAEEVVEAAKSLMKDAGLFGITENIDFSAPSLMNAIETYDKFVKNGK